jgi:hypothetical protein
VKKLILLAGIILVILFVAGLSQFVQSNPVQDPLAPPGTVQTASSPLPAANTPAAPAPVVTPAPQPSVIPTVLVNSLTLAVVGNGTTNPPAGTAVYSPGSKIAIAATSDAGWQFDHWSGDVSGNSPSTIVEINGPKVAIANFAKKGAVLSLAVNGSGATDPAVGGHPYEAGSVVSISATPGPGWQFQYWIGNVVSPTSASTTVAMTQDRNVTAYFSRKPVTVGPETRSAGTGSNYWRMSLEAGDTVELSFTVPGGNTSWTARNFNGVTVGSGSITGLSGHGSFTAAASGDFQLNLFTPDLTPSAQLTVSYTITPKVLR